MTLTRVELREKGIDIVVWPVYIKEATAKEDRKEYSFFVYAENRDEVGDKQATELGGWVNNPHFVDYEEAEACAVGIANRHFNETGK